MQANGFSGSESAITSGQPCRRLRRGLGTRGRRPQPDGPMNTVIQESEAASTQG